MRLHAVIGRLLAIASLVGIAAGFPLQSMANSPLFQNLATNSFATVADLQRDGQWLIVMIWAHDCEVCEREVGDYQQFHRRLDGGIARVVGVTLDGEEYKQDALKFVARHGLEFDNLIAEPEVVVGYYQVVTGSQWIGTPSFLIFGPDGELMAKQAGAVEVEIVENFITANSQ